jgi:hypothetical protein
VAHHVRRDARLAQRAARDAGFERAVGHGAHDLGQRRDAGLDRDVGQALAERRQQPRRGLVPGAGAVADAHAAALARAERARCAPQLVGRPEQRGPALEQEPAGVGELDVVGRAPQQLDAELLLEQAHLAAERGLGDVQAFRGAREVPLAGDGEEVAQAPQVRHAPAYR